MNDTTSVSLVLGSGGARGLAHIGVIQWLEENGYEIRAIAGSSMGALVGGIYAAGELDAYRRWVTALDRADVLRLLDLSFRWGGLLKGDRIVDRLRDLIGDREIGDLPISYTAVATDLERGREVWLSRGPLFNAIRASIAVPLLFTPHEINGRKLLDGGLLNPLPMAPTLHDQNDVTIVVNVDARPDHPLAHRQPAERDPSAASRTDHDGPDSQREGVKGIIQDLQDRLTTERRRDWGFFEVMMLSIETMQSTIARMKMAPYAPDHYLVIHNDIARAHEFYRARELIQLGHDTAARSLPPGGG